MADRSCLTCKRWAGRCCMVLKVKRPIRDCWAWTDDPDWAEKVRRAVEAYRKGDIEGAKKAR